MRLAFEKRADSTPLGHTATIIGAVVLALLFGAGFLTAVGVDPLEAYALVVEEVFLSAYGWQDLLVKFTPLLFTGCAVALAAQMRLWNIGAEGQFHMGTVFVTWGSLHLNPDTWGWGMLLVMGLLAVAGGGLWGSIPGVLKARFGVNEIITSLLLNYVAVAWVDQHLFGSWRDPDSNNFPITQEFAEVARLPSFGDTSVHFGIVLALIVAVVVAWILLKTKLGFQIQLTGDNPDAAGYAGVNSRLLIILVFAFSGAIAGLAGFSEVSGIHYRLQQNISIGYGYTGIIVAWLARNHPLGIILSALFMAVIFVSAEMLQIEYGLPIAMVYLYQGVILFTVLGSEIFTGYKLRLRTA